ncbi:unsaturated rhamnogalacturonyl hydrolase YesR [Nocardioides baekrokdamisoli]|uniref:Unsaturated rhamnogalacturonyl hydrolase YesR n=1 Tax=Nocardioides baekrokdamisoli TaxID=1804624 RepID=A0A3G9IEP9_9ACTN|nr:glycoside hydrolase family 88 protein [Nocardioides baekrokdamisoli]BBH16762.1 unsaturated rhamnogalacturonyl hydrolase YesR [Nocardioides baekrokdamisoli]
MASEDTDNARLADPPLPPVGDEALTRESLAATADRVAAATWRLGLPRWFWGEGVCLTGLVQAGLVYRGDIPREVIEWFETQIASDPLATLDHVNEVAPGAAAADLGDPTHTPVLEALLAWTRNPDQPRAANGAIEHWPGGVWADTMYMVGRFMLRFGVRTGDAALVRAGVREVLAQTEILQAENGLFVHGAHRGDVIPCYWGRANAWAALALVETLEALDEMGITRLPIPEFALRRQLAALVEVQPWHGVWDVLVDGNVETRGILETSATAGIGAALLRAGRLLDEPTFTDAGWAALRGVLAYEQDGLLTRVSAGTVLQLVPFGYSVIRDDRPQLWGQGLLLTALAAAGRHPAEP